MGLLDRILKTSVKKHEKNLSTVLNGYKKKGSGKPLDPNEDFNRIKRTRSPDTVNACKSLSERGYENYISAFNAMIGKSSITLDDIAAVQIYPDNQLCFLTYDPVDSFSTASLKEACRISDVTVPILEKSCISFDEAYGIFNELISEADDISTLSNRREALNGSNKGDVHCIGYIMKMSLALEEHIDDHENFKMYKYVVKMIK